MIFFKYEFVLIRLPFQKKIAYKKNNKFCSIHIFLRSLKKHNLKKKDSKQCFYFK